MAENEKKRTRMQETLEDIQQLVKWGVISAEYFGKTRSWIYQRISGYEVNGRPAEFTAEDKERLRNALHDVARRIDAAADSIE